MSIDLQWILHTIRPSPNPQIHNQTSPQPCYTGFAPQTAQLGNHSETDKWSGFHQSKLCLRPGSTEMLPYRAERRGHRSLRFVLAGKLGWGNRQRRGKGTLDQNPTATHLRWRHKLCWRSHTLIAVAGPRRSAADRSYWGYHWERLHFPFSTAQLKIHISINSLWHSANENGGHEWSCVCGLCVNSLRLSDAYMRR